MKTIAQLKNDDNFLCGLEISEYHIKLYLTYIGSDKLQYHMFWNDELLFTGNSYKPSILYNVDSVTSVVGLLDFLCLQKGDVEHAYFANYTPEQIKWRNSLDCEELKSRTLDFFNDDQLDGETFHIESIEWFTKCFIQ